MKLINQSRPGLGNRNERASGWDALSRTFAENPGALAACGFSLIEFIAVLAIISILSLILIGVIIKRVDFAAYNAEQTSLASITNALVQQVLLNKQVPSSTNPTNWAQSSANWLNLPVSQILTNARNNARAYLVDTNGWLGSPDALNGYTQTTNGTAFAPINARVLIISSIGKPLPLASGPLSPSAFFDIWNTGSLQKPASWNNTWAGRGEDLVIQRLTFTPCFNHLILINHFDNSAAFTIDPSPAPVSVPQMPPSTSGWDSYYITGSSLGLCSNNVVNTVQMKIVMQNDSSYIYESPGAWMGSIGNGPVTTNSYNPANNFSLVASNFLQAGWLPDTTANKNFFVGTPPMPQGTPQDVLTAMEGFMATYTSWANTTPAFSHSLYHSMNDYLATEINNGIIMDGGISGPGILY